MKANFIVGVVVMAQAFFANAASPGKLYCSAVDVQGNQSQIVIDFLGKTVVQNAPVNPSQPLGGYKKVEEWVIVNSKKTAKTITVNGSLGGAGFGSGGFVDINLQKTTHPDVYTGRAKIEPESARVSPIKLFIVLNLNCR